MNLALLKTTALLADLDDAQLARVAEICQEQTYRGGEVIFSLTFLAMSIF